MIREEAVTAVANDSKSIDSSGGELSLGKSDRVKALLRAA